VQILKAFTPVFVVVMLYVTRVDIPSRRVTFSIVALCLGTSIASAGAPKPNPTNLLAHALCVPGSKVAEAATPRRRHRQPTPIICCRRVQV
jgi:hypothetical protein